MFAVIIESSHKRGMGHLFRAIVVYSYLQEIKEQCIIITNSDSSSEKELDVRKIVYYTVKDASNYHQVEDILHKNNIRVAIIDKFSSDYEYIYYLKRKNYFLVGIDDMGSGAMLYQMHFCPLLIGHKKLGKRIFDETKYIILNRDISKYKRERNSLTSILITMGGTDTYGVTYKVCLIIKKLDVRADILIGPGSKVEASYLNYEDNKHSIITNVTSLVELFSRYDLIICGGGITCLEANASGLPCIIIANEEHEISIGKWVSGFGGAVFAGSREDDYSEYIMNIGGLDICEMSKKALQAFSCEGVNNVVEKIFEGYKQWRKQER